MCLWAEPAIHVPAIDTLKNNKSTCDWEPIKDNKKKWLSTHTLLGIGVDRSLRTIHVAN